MQEELLPKIEIKKFALTGAGAKKNRAMFDVEVAGHFVIKKVSLTEGDKGLYVQFPLKQGRTKNGKGSVPVAYPFSAAASRAVKEMALQRYEELTRPNAASKNTVGNQEASNAIA